MNQLTSLFKILSDETRLRILFLLYQEELCVCQLTGILKMPQPKISKSLSKLRDLGLVSDDRREKFVYYSLKRESKALMKILEDLDQDIFSYPVLLEDRKGLENKEYFLSQCGPGNVKKGFNRDNDYFSIFKQSTAEDAMAV